MKTVVPGASIIVPTFREVDNIRPLVERIFKAVRQAGIEAEVLIVDDNSQDGTEEAVASLQDQYPVRLIVRRSERGLSSAVLAGFREARYDHLCVLDADLQHPPEMLPALLEKLGNNNCDFVIGTRYSGRGVIASEWPLGRRIASKVASLMARPLARLSDPMSGFFALSRQTWLRAKRLDPVGYKIALELFVKARCSQPAEVPIEFGVRLAGKSKFGFREQFHYLRHLSRLYRFRFPWLVYGLALVALLGIGLLIFFRV